MNKRALLKYYLLIFGLLNIVGNAGIYLFEGLLWQPRNFPEELMLSAVYIALGIVMLTAARAPLKHKALIDFVILSSIPHAIIMLIYHQNSFHLIDVGFIGLLGLVPLLIYPWKYKNFLRYED